MSILFITAAYNAWVEIHPLFKHGLLGFVISLCMTYPAYAADPQPYTVEIKSTGNGELDAALEGSAMLVSLRDRAAAGPFALVSRAKADVDRLKIALNSFGYYQGTALIEIQGHALNDADLPSVLGKLKKNTSARIIISPQLGPLYHLRNISLEGPVPDTLQTKFALKSGDPALAAQVLAAGDQLLMDMREDGYALAIVDKPIAYADDEAKVLDLSFKLDPGRKANIGTIKFTGLETVNESFVRKLLTIQHGDKFRPSKIEDARHALASAGVFSGVEVAAGDQLDAQDRIDLTFNMEERPRHAVGVTAAYSTDVGASLSVSWSHRNLFGNAEQLNLAAAGSGIAGRITNALGYDLSAQYMQPFFLEPEQVLDVKLSLVKQTLDAYEQTAITLGAFVRRKFSTLWQASIGVTAMQDRVGEQSDIYDYQLFSLPFVVNYDSTGLNEPLSDPIKGVRASLSAIPTKSFGRSDTIFVSMQAVGSAYFDFSSEHDQGHSVLALRALLASIQGASQFDLPPDQRLYAGGSGTVRGYDYQSVGPLYPDGKPMGGLSAVAATVEWRQRIYGDFGAVVFADAGQASQSSAPFTGTLRMGAGAGIRYYTPIGAARLDIALPLNPPRGASAFGLYIGLGQAF